LFRGQDSVVHLAFHREPHPAPPPVQLAAASSAANTYEAERANVDLAYRVFQLAQAEGVRRVVVASSNHAADWYEHLIHAGRRDLGAYLSARDLQQLVVKSLETERIEDAHGIPWQVFYGISNNTRAFWSIANARRVIGYAPEDDSEVLFAADIRRVLADVPGR